MLQRNAAVALGNTGDNSALPALAHAMLSNENPIVRSHAAWAIGNIGRRLGAAQAASILDAALTDEIDEDVRDEIRLAIEDCRHGNLDAKNL
jgi:epoxyqueuosine reductase